MSSGTRYSVVSCHVERLLDDAVWARLERFLARRPGGFTIAPLVRPPDPDEGEAKELWAERVRRAAQLGPLGHHTHFGGVAQARPTAGGAADRVRREADAFAAAGVEPRFFCGGGWYMDAEVARVVADLGYVDCTATSYRQPYLEDDDPYVSVTAPTWLELEDGRRLLEVPATHSIGMLARSVAAPRLPVQGMHVYFHDWDLADLRRRAVLAGALRVLRLRREPLALDEAAARAARTAAVVPFATAAGRAATPVDG